jgi:hypothetical protein
VLAAFPPRDESNLLHWSIPLNFQIQDRSGKQVAVDTEDPAIVAGFKPKHHGL